MNLQRYRFTPDYTGIFNNTNLDSVVNVSPYGHPAVVPDIPKTTPTTSTGKQIQNGSSSPVATLSGGNAWTVLDTLMYTHQAGDYFEFTTSAPIVIIALTGLTSVGEGLHVGAPGLALNTLRNGGLVTISVGGVVQQSADCFSATPVNTLYLDGTSHVIRVTMTGNCNAGVHPLSSVAALVGTTVAAGLAVSISTTQKTFTAATWRVLATGAGTFSLFHTPQGGVESLVVAGLTTGVVYDASNRVPGVSLTLTGTLTNTHSATFSTDVITVGVRSLGIVTGAGGNFGSYQSAVIDSHAPDTQWFLAEWLQSDFVEGHTNGVGGYTSPSFTLQTGNTPTPDLTWASYGVTPGQVLLPKALLRYGSAGLMAAPRGRYAVWTLTFPLGLTDVPWFRDPVIYYWVPERDPHFLAKFAVAREWTPDPVLNAVLGTMACFSGDTAVAVADFVASYSIQGAVDQYLFNIGLDLGLGQVGSETPLAYRIRLTAALASRPTGGSPAYIATQVATLVGGVAPTLTSSVGANLLTVTASSAGLATGPVQVAQTGSFGFTVTIPPPGAGGGYPNLPGLAIPVAQGLISGFVATIKPVGAIPTVTFL